MAFTGTSNKLTKIENLKTDILSFKDNSIPINVNVNTETLILTLIQEIENLKSIVANVQNPIRIGTIVPFAGEALNKIDHSILPPPLGYDWCFGQIVSKSDEKYSALYSVIGDNWNTSTELTDDQFQLPDLRDVFLRGCNTDSPESTNYRAVGNFQSCGVPNLLGHSGGIYLAQYAATTVSSYGWGCLRTVNSGETGRGAATVDVAMPAITFNASLYSSIYKEGLTEVRPDNKAVNYIIKL